MAQDSDLASGDATDAQTVDSSISSANLRPETQTHTLTSVTSSGTSSVSRNNRSNMGVPTASSLSSDALPRPHSHVQRSTSDTEVEGSRGYDQVLRGLVGRSNSASFDPEHVPEDAELLRQRLLAAALSTPVSGDAVSSRLLQALPQLSINQFLQDLNNQTPNWRGFAAGRQDVEDNSAQADETGTLLSTQGVDRGLEEGSSSRSRRRLSSGSSLYSMSSSGEFEPSINHTPQPGTTGNGTETAVPAQPTVRVGNSTRGRRNSEDESDDQTAMDELQALFRRCHNSLPFVALFLIYFAYQHATGILVFAVGTVAVMGLDQRMRAQVALKDKANSWHLLGIVAMCAIDMIALCSIDGQPNPLRHFSQIFESETTDGSSSDSDSGHLSSGGVFWQVLWTVLVNGMLDIVYAAVDTTFSFNNLVLTVLGRTRFSD
ncbi:hypothetical protein P3T76_012614 [Phytophthora citrophthora]|uniref:Transmembrane protein n=1 Tax=Phytophthora citrophthora TaxID=4793 RepID=A0AAD9G4S2_9STRA|nr:hypothetical protein P3T76_012614 [Phytophthora citrophthora]